MTNIFSSKTLGATTMLLGSLLGACAREQQQQPTQVAAAQSSDSSGGIAEVSARRVNRAAPMTCDNAPVFFASGSDQLDESGRARLDALSNCLRNRSLSEIIITGRADPRGTEPENQQLGARRAETVANYLRDRGITGVTLTMRSEGEAGAVQDPSLYPYQRNAHVQVQPGQGAQNNSNSNARTQQNNTPANDGHNHYSGRGQVSGQGTYGSGSMQINGSAGARVGQ